MLFMLHVYLAGTPVFPCFLIFIIYIRVCALLYICTRLSIEVRSQLWVTFFFFILVLRQSVIKPEAYRFR